MAVELEKEEASVGCCSFLPQARQRDILVFNKVRRSRVKAEVRFLNKKKNILNSTGCEREIN